MKYAKQLRAPQTVQELVPAEYCLQVYPTAPDSCIVTPISRVDGSPGTPLAVNDDSGFTSDVYSDDTQAFRIEALSDAPVHYAVSKGKQPALIIDQFPPRVPAEG